MKHKRITLKEAVDLNLCGVTLYYKERNKTKEKCEPKDWHPRGYSELLEDTLRDYKWYVEVE